MNSNEKTPFTGQFCGTMMNGARSFESCSQKRMAQLGAPPTELNLDRGRPRGRPLHLRAAWPIERILRTEHLAISVSTRPAALPSLGKHRLTPLNGISWKALSSPSGNAFSSFEVCSLPHCRIAGGHLPGASASKMPAQDTP